MSYILTTLMHTLSNFHLQHPCWSLPPEWFYRHLCEKKNLNYKIAILTAKVTCFIIVTCFFNQRYQWLYLILHGWELQWVFVHQQYNFIVQTLTELKFYIITCSWLNALTILAPLCWAVRCTFITSNVKSSSYNTQYYIYIWNLL